MKVIPLSSLEKVFHDEIPAGEKFTGCSFLLGEEVSFQLAFCADEDTQALPEISASAGAYEAFWVEEIPSEKQCYDDSDDWYLRKTPGLYPDLLRPAEYPLPVQKAEWHSLWIAFQSEESVHFTVKLGGEQIELHFTCIPQRLPEQTLLCTDWLHCDGLAQAYHLEPFSEPFWQTLDQYLRCYTAHGMNMILTPLFTPPLDTEVDGERMTTQLVEVTLEPNASQYKFDFTQLKRWFDLCRACGIKAFELSHLFTQWGARHAPKIIVNGARRFGWDTDADSSDYEDFLAQFAAALLPFLAQEHLTDCCYIHVSDEPELHDLAVYAKRAAFIKRIFPSLKMIDALSDYEFYRQGLIARPIPSNSAIAPFLGRVPELWTYYCCSQHKSYVSNRFFAMPPARCRVLGLQLWKFRCAGFLHWGFNFWNSQLSKHPIDPFTCADAGAAFPSGDAFVVYPGEAGPLCSLRLKVFHEALQDLRALSLLEAKIGHEKTLALLEEGLEAPLTFEEYPRSAAWLLELRERVNRAIAAQP